MQNTLLSASLRCLAKKVALSTPSTSSRSSSQIRTISSAVAASPKRSFRYRSSSLTTTLAPKQQFLLQSHPFLSTSAKTSQSSSSPPEPNPIAGHDLLIDGQHIHYEQAGHGPHVILLLPGAIGTGLTDFRPQLEWLNPELFTAIAWDPPGYGHSRPPERDFNDFYRKDAAVAAKLMQAIGYTRYSVLGWSDGGITGMILTANQGSSCVQKLIIWGSNAYVNEEDRNCLHKVRNPRTDWSDAFRATFIDLYGEEYFYRLWDRLVANYMTLDDICTKDLAKIHCPVLILHGDLDPMVSSEHPVHLVNTIPNATLFRFPKGKHNIHQRYADEFNKLVEDFLNTK